MSNIKKQDIVNYGQWIQPTLSGTFWCYWYTAEGIKDLVLDQPVHSLIFLDGHSMLIKADVSSIKRVAKKIFDQRHALRYIELVESLGKRFELAHRSILDGPRDYQTYLPALFSTYLNLVGLWWFTIPLSLELESEVKKMWPELNDDALFHLARPVRPTWLETQNREIKLFAQEIKKILGSNTHSATMTLIKRNDLLFQKIQTHVKEFAWFGTHHWMGEPYTLPKCLDQINDVLKRLPTKRIAIINQTDVPQYISTLLGTLNFWRTHCAELTAKVIFLSRPVLEEVAKVWHLNYDDLIYLSHHEILCNLDKKVLPRGYIRLIEQRKIGYGCVIDKKGNEQIYVGRGLKQILQELTEVKTIEIDTVRGVVASRGDKIKGRVCIIMSPRDFKNFKKGNILITNETTPDLVPLMRIAAAVITDLGGLTSHAAIVSRELALPCIVGTKIATKIFKNGDMIELDASRGIVKLVK